jgi:large subunit ribosomal protein L4
MAKINTETSASIKLPVKRLDGSPTGEEVLLDPNVFGLPRNDHVMYLAVKAELSNRRQGTAATKTRALISGGGKKPWKQKGRGGARAGSNRSPVWKGGGTMFGPQPHYYLQFVPTRVKRLARRVALSVKAQGGFIDILEDFEFEAPKTGRIAETLRAFGAAGSSALIMIDGNKPSIVKSCRNIPRLAIRDSIGASTYDIMRARKLLICKSALEKLVGGLTSE